MMKSDIGFLCKYFTYCEKVWRYLDSWQLMRGVRIWYKFWRSLSATQHKFLQQKQDVRQDIYHCARGLLHSNTGENLTIKY